MDGLEIARQIKKVVHAREFDFWLLNAQNRIENLLCFLRDPNIEIPAGAEVFTSEEIYPGSYLESLMRSECVNWEADQELKEAERVFLIGFAREIQGLGVFNGVGRKLLELARSRGIRLWLGSPFVENPAGLPPKLYNAYLLVENGEIRFVHRKKFLWDGGKHKIDAETDVFQAVGKDRRAPISTTEYDGIFENRACLICQEADAFFCPKWRKRMTHVPEVRKTRPDFVVIPARWLDKVGTEEKCLQKIALAVARRIKEPLDKFSAVRRRGCLALVVNAYETYICGPVDEKKVKARVYARQSERGWLRINNEGVTRGKF